MQEATCLKALAIVTHRPEEWSLDVLAMFGEIEIVTNALRCLWMNSKTPLLAALRTTFRESNPGSCESHRL